MFNRSELKERGKINFKRFYWKSVIVCIITLILTSSVNGGVSSRVRDESYNYNDYSYDENYNYNDIEEYDDNFLGDIGERVKEIASTGFFYVFSGLMLIIGIIGIIIKLLIVYPIEIGKNNYFMGIRQEERSLDNLICIYKSGYLKNTIITMFLKGLFQSLWSLLFIIPGIIKTYEYRMIPYILSENPSLSRQRAFEISKDMMRGNKWNTFVLDLSFIGWYILSGFTIGLLGIFYVNPYVESTNAELYAYLRHDALSKGYASSNELIGF